MKIYFLPVSHSPSIPQQIIQTFVILSRLILFIFIMNPKCNFCYYLVLDRILVFFNIASSYLRPRFSIASWLADFVVKQFYFSRTHWCLNLNFCTLEKVSVLSWMRARAINKRGNKDSPLLLAYKTIVSTICT